MIKQEDSIIKHDSLIFEHMQMAHKKNILIENHSLYSEFLHRDVKVDFYLPVNIRNDTRLLLINDGQLMEEMNFADILEQFHTSYKGHSLVCVAIHAGKERKMEYGIVSQADYKGRGAKANLYTAFVLKELFPFVREKISFDFSEKAFAGFSLGGLSALDIVWNHSDIFSKVAVFSGSFWWRSVDQKDKNYADDKHRIMQQVIRNDNYKPGLKFFFQCGNMDETKDRNNNGIIDSIDDTLDIIKELKQKGYDATNDIFYLEMKEGRHDEKTWAKVFPVFLQWAYK